MNRIAEELGIRKQSLSYHYASKSKLLIDTYADAVEEEVTFLEEFFSNTKSLGAKETLVQFLKETQQRYYEQPTIAFLQSMSFKAPMEVSDLNDILCKKAIVGCRSEEHTSELQSRFDLVCRLLLEKKK